MAYRGFVAELPWMQGGLHGAATPSAVPPTHFVEANNVTFENGVLQKEGGAAKYNSTAIANQPRIVAGHDWWPDEQTQRMIVFVDYKNGNSALLKDIGTGTFSTTLFSGTGQSNTCIFAEGGKEAAAQARKLFIFTGAFPVKVLSGDGNTVSNLAQPPADWSTSYPTFGLLHEGRLWGGGNQNDPHRIYYSTVDDHENFVGAGSGSLSIYPGEGQKLIAGVSFHGLLVLFKFPAGIYIVDTRDPSIVNWKVWRHSSAIGCASPQAIAIVEDDLVFIDQVGQIQRLSGIQEFGSVGSQTLGDADAINVLIRRELEAQRYATKLRAVYYARKRELHFAFPFKTSSECDRRLVLDMNIPGRPRWRLSDRDRCVSLWLRRDGLNRQQLVAGDDTGTVWLLDQAVKSKDGQGYTASARTAQIDFSFIDPSLMARTKIGQFLEVTYDIVGNWNVAADIYWDGVYHQTVTFNMAAGGDVLGSFVLGTSKIAPNIVLNQRRRITGYGRTFAIAIRNNVAEQDFSIARVRLYFQVGDERSRKS